MEGYFFKSSLFEITKGEDDETNPGCYGKSLASWLSLKLKEFGYDDLEIIPEDWGWCVMCSRDIGLLWVGCGNVYDEEFHKSFNPKYPPKGSEVTWTAFTEMELPPLSFKERMKNLFSKQDVVESPEKIKLYEQLGKILESEPSIALCSAP